MINFLLVLMLLNTVSTPEDVLLSFDVEKPDDATTMMHLLHILAEEEIHATFFIEGGFALREPAVVKRILLEGHEIGCHTVNHSYLPTLSKKEQRAEIGECKQIFDELNISISGFRAPYHLLDWRTYALLKEEEFAYDASRFRTNLQTLHVRQLKISTFFGLPLEDYTLLVTLKLKPKCYFWMLNHHAGNYHSFAFHPHHIMQHEESFRNMLHSYTKKNAQFLTHEGFLSENI